MSSEDAKMEVEGSGDAGRGGRGGRVHGGRGRGGRGRGGRGRGFGGPKTCYHCGQVSSLCQICKVFLSTLIGA